MSERDFQSWVDALNLAFLEIFLGDDGFRLWMDAWVYFRSGSI